MEHPQTRMFLHFLAFFFLLLLSKALCPLNFPVVVKAVMKTSSINWKTENRNCTISTNKHCCYVAGIGLRQVSHTSPMEIS